MDTITALSLGLILPLLLAFGISEIILRFTGYRRLQKDFTAQAMVKIQETSDTDFETIGKILLELPPKIEIDKHVELLREQLSFLAAQLRDRPSPLSSWSEKLQETASVFGRLLPIENKVQPILTNKTLQIKAHSDARLTKQLDNFRVAAQERNKERCGEIVLQLYDEARELTQLIEHWLELRIIASSGIDTVDKVRLIEEHGGWLSHGIGNNFQDPVTKQELVWFPWDVLSRPDLLDKLTNWVTKETQDAGWRFDAICAMSSTGLPVATLMSMRLGTELLAIDNVEFCFLPKDAPNPGERILLVDSGLQTGRHLSEATKRIENARAIVAGVICISFNDFLPQNKTELNIVEHMIQRNNLRYLFQISDLYELWKERRWSGREQG
jgi:orotate phosphoribosyltransferase